ncbi:MAG: winged helix-turn-helix domain-containing protein [Methanosarcinales archaeon]|nr:winged helix-turn-helix domain-containing protein [Methanosarcinales archaeon]
MGKDRSRWEIILDILHVIKKDEKIKKTRLMQKAYLDWRNFKKYFDYLLEENFISESNPDSGSFSLTENGVELLDRLKKVNELLN